MSKKNISSNSPVPSCPVPSCHTYTHRDYVNSVKDMINFQSFDFSDRPLVNSFCKIIADVLMKSPDEPMRIKSTWIKARIVQEKFSQLDERHIDVVLKKFKENAGKIKSLEPYVQTMLFNIQNELPLVEEIESQKYDVEDEE